MKRKLIFIISNEPWSDIKLSKHHYAIALAKNEDYCVCFINPVGKYSPFSSFAPRFNLLNDEQLTIVDYNQLLPYRNKVFTKINDRIMFNKLKSHFNFNKFSDVIFWQFDSFRFIKLPKRDKVKRIYHVADSLIVTKFDAEIAKLADLVVCTNKNFVANYLRVNANTIHVPHGVSAVFFEKSSLVIQKIKEEINPFFILIGSLNMHTDFELLYKIAEKYEDKTLLIIGPNKTQNNLTPLITKQNVVYMERMDLPKLNNYIAASSVGIIPYLDENNNGRTPLKTINYLTQGVPVFSSIPTGIPDLSEKSIFYYANFQDFQVLTDRYGKDECTNDYNAAYLKSIKYSNLIDIILKHLL